MFVAQTSDDGRAAAVKNAPLHCQLHYSPESGENIDTK